MNRKRTQTEGSDASDHFVSVNERPVDDIREFMTIIKKIIFSTSLRDYFNVFERQNINQPLILTLLKFNNKIS